MHFMHYTFDILLAQMSVLAARGPCKPEHRIPLSQSIDRHMHRIVNHPTIRNILIWVMTMPLNVSENEEIGGLAPATIRRSQLDGGSKFEIVRSRLPPCNIILDNQIWTSYEQGIGNSEADYR
jgi:hypothetical protein